MFKTPLFLLTRLLRCGVFFAGDLGTGKASVCDAVTGNELFSERVDPLDFIVTSAVGLACARIVYHLPLCGCGCHDVLALAQVNVAATAPFRGFTNAIYWRAWLF